MRRAASAGRFGPAFFLAGAGALAAVAVLPRLADFIVVSGNRVVPYPGEDILLDYALGVLWALLLACGLAVWPGLGAARRSLLALWGLKAFTSLGLGLAFEYAYALDGDGYFANAIRPDFEWFVPYIGGGTENIWLLTRLQLALVPGSYHAAKVGFSMLGLIALYHFYKAATEVSADASPASLVCVGAYPSVLLWSSLLTKDPVMLLAVALYARGSVAWLVRRSFSAWPQLVAGLVIALLVRPWYAPIMIFPLIAATLAGARQNAWKWLSFGGFMIALAVALRSSGEDFRISSFEDLLDSRSAAHSSFEGGGSTFQGIEVDGMLSGVLKLPQAVFLALYRPLPLEVPNAFGWIQGFDNLFLLCLTLRAALRTRWRELLSPPVLWAVLFVVSWAGVYGFVVANFGSLARYKLQVMPIFLYLLIYLGRRRAAPGAKPPSSEATVCAA